MLKELLALCWKDTIDIVRDDNSLIVLSIRTLIKINLE